MYVCVCVCVCFGKTKQTYPNTVKFHGRIRPQTLKLIVVTSVRRNVTISNTLSQPDVSTYIVTG